MDDNLYSDDLMPNDSSVFELTTDDERVQETNEEKHLVQAAGPLLDTILGWFDDEIMLSNSIDGLDLESVIDIKAQVLARQILKAKLTGAKERLQALKDEHVS